MPASPMPRFRSPGWIRRLLPALLVVAAGGCGSDDAVQGLVDQDASIDATADSAVDSQGSGKC